MTWRLLILLVFLLRMLPAQHGLDEARTAYARGDYVGAEAVLKRGLVQVDGKSERAVWEYNLGNCAFRVGRYADAIWRYRRALQCAPQFADARHNLRHAESRMGLGEQVNSFGRNRWAVLDPLLTSITLPTLVFIEFLAVLGALWFRRHGLLRLAFIGLLLFSLFLGARICYKENSHRATPAVILETGARLCSEPHRSKVSTAELRQGTIIEVVAQSKHWAQVRCVAGDGWILRSKIGLVE